MAAMCRATRPVRLILQEAKPPPCPPWRSALQLLCPGPPAPYVGETADFHSDADALITASLAGKKKADLSRWPALFVTDSSRFCEAAADLSLRAALATAASLRDRELLPVVLAADFGTLCGLHVEGAPLDACTSLFARGVSVQSSQSSSRELRRLNCPEPLAVFMQQSRVRGGEDGTPTAHDPGEAQPSLFGVRFLALLGNGRCAYSAVSIDGSRRIEIHGAWEIINGRVVLGGTKGRSTELQSVCVSGEWVAEEVPPGPPVHISIKDLETNFQAPFGISELRSFVRIAMLESRQHMSLDDPPCFPEFFLEPNDTEQDSPQAADSPDPLPNFDATFQTTWGSSSGPARTEIRKSQTKESIRFSRTATHALRQQLELSLEVEGEPESMPRLLGLKRGITRTTLADDDTITGRALSIRDLSPKSPSGEAMIFSQVLNEFSVCSAVCSQPGPNVGGCDCPVQIGTYRLQDGEHHKLEMTLHANGQCDYRERLGGDVLRSLSDASWRVKDDLLILEQSGARCFLLRQTRGSRSVVQKVGRLELPVDFLQQRFEHEPPRRDLEPCPNHEPLPADQLIFGAINPCSPALAGMSCRPDRLPFHAFQRELRALGLQCDEILSDFEFFDRDEDGEVSLADMRRLCEYGSPHAAPEVLHSLHNAIVHDYGCMESAFDVMSSQPAGATLESFEQWVLDPATDAPEQSKLKEWGSNTSAEDRVAVFASLNQRNCQEIDLTDMRTLHLHSAMLAARRLRHFQGWIFERFGRSDSVFVRVFRAMGGEGEARALSKKDFVDGVRELGYPCGPDVAASAFGLLDRNVDGKLGLREFKRLREFSPEHLLTSLEALKSYAEDKFGGVDACFKKLLEREHVLQGLGRQPKTISLATFQKFCSQADLMNSEPVFNVKSLFLFLDAVSGSDGHGFLNHKSWSILKGFNSRVITGNPARLHKILDEQYGGVDEAFERMHTSWLKRALTKGLRRQALVGLARALCQTMNEAPSVSPGPMAPRAPSTSRPSTARPATARRPGSAARSIVSSNLGSRPNSARASRCRTIRGGGRRPVVMSSDSPALPQSLRPPDCFPRPDGDPRLLPVSAIAWDSHTYPL